VDECAGCAVSMMVAEPATALEEASRVSVCAIPGVRTRVEGLAAMPAGRPVTAILTVSAKDPVAVASTESVAEPPGAKETEAGVALSV
jgi:hypothetical protein